MGSKPAKAPAPTKEERELQKAQADLLKQQQAIIEQQRQQQSILLPFLAEQQGFDVEVDPSTGAITSITKRANETDEINKTLEKELAQHSLKALRGELPVDPALEKELATQETTLREKLTQQFGPGYENSSGGVEAMQKFRDSSAALRSQARRGELTLGQQLGMAREQQNDYKSGSALDYLRQVSTGDNLAFAGAFGQVAQGYGNAQQSYIQQRQMQMQASMANAQRSSSILGAGIGAIGSVLSTPAAGAFLFSDEKLKANAVRISTLKPFGIPIYTYTMGGEKRIGVFASDVERVLPEAVGRRMGYKTVNYEALDGSVE